METEGWKKGEEENVARKTTDKNAYINCLKITL